MDGNQGNSVIMDWDGGQEIYYNSGKNSIPSDRVLISDQVVEQKMNEPVITTETGTTFFQKPKAQKEKQSKTAKLSEKKRRTNTTFTGNSYIGVFSLTEGVDYQFIWFLVICFVFSVAQAMIGLVVLFHVNAIFPVIYSIPLLAIAVFATLYWVRKEIVFLKKNPPLSFRHTKELHAAFIVIFLSWYGYIGSLYAWWIVLDLPIDSKGPDPADRDSVFQYKMVMMIPVFLISMQSFVLVRAIVSHLWPEVVYSMERSRSISTTLMSNKKTI